MLEGLIHLKRGAESPGQADPYSLFQQLSLPAKTRNAFQPGREKKIIGCRVSGSVKNSFLSDARPGTRDTRYPTPDTLVPCSTRVHPWL